MRAWCCLLSVVLLLLTLLLRRAPVTIMRRSKPTLQQHLHDHCHLLEDEYSPLLQSMFAHWNTSGVSLDLLTHTSGERVYISNGKVFLSDSTGWGRTIPTFVRYIQHISKIVHLPDIILPLNPADEPQAALKYGEDPRPLISFCKIPGFSDVLMPNTAEGDVFNRPRATRGDRRRLMSGPDDPRKASVVWRGTTMSHKRHLFLQLGVDHPDLVDSGVSHWDNAAFGPDLGRHKPHIKMREQINKYKYQAWLPGNCASIRMALQLAADACIFKVEHDDTEWYYPLLQPYVHYVPVTANATHTDLLEKLEWAERHPQIVRDIVISANHFAHRYLSSSGRDCYFMQFLQKLRDITIGQPTRPPGTFVAPK